MWASISKTWMCIIRSKAEGEKMRLKHILHEGDRFGRLTVLGQVAPAQNGSRMFLCSCECGAVRAYRVEALVNGRAKSCGCYHRDRVTKHGDSLSAKKRTPLYKKWSGIKIRCNNASAQSFKYYGARNITYCEEWNDYKNFREWALSSGYRDGLEIDRIDPNGNYEPGNCRWVTRSEQDYNKRNTLLYNGEPLKRVCQRLGMNYSRVWRRIKRDGWEIEKALYTPLKPYNRKEL